MVLPYHAGRMLRLRVAASLLLIGLLAALALAGCVQGSDEPRRSAGADAASSLMLRSANVHYYQSGPTDPVVELRIIVENTHRRHTDSTTILWDAEFTRNFVFLRSDPPAWRYRVDEQGRGTLDTTGVIPGQYATFKIWFAAGTYAPMEPRILFVANGNVEVAETIAEASHLGWQRPRASQQAFERGGFARAIAPAAIVPATGFARYLLAVLLGISLTALTVGGAVIAFRATARESAPLRLKPG